MWIVRLALRRPLSVAVMTLLMLVLGVLAFTRMNVDIFPAIDLPVVIEVWNYPGLSATDMERQVTFYGERVTTSATISSTWSQNQLRAPASSRSISIREQRWRAGSRR